MSIISVVILMIIAVLLFSLIVQHNGNSCCDSISGGVDKLEGNVPKKRTGEINIDPN